jgi:hypothetical protein
MFQYVTQMGLLHTPSAPESLRAAFNITMPINELIATGLAYEVQWRIKVVQWRNVTFPKSDTNHEVGES